MSKPEKNFFKDRQDDLKMLIATEKISFYGQVDYFLGTNNMPLIIGALESLKASNPSGIITIERARKELADLWYKYLDHKTELESLEKHVIK